MPNLAIKNKKDGQHEYAPGVVSEIAKATTQSNPPYLYRWFNQKFLELKIRVCLAPMP